MGYPRIYGATTMESPRVVILLPLSFQNTGPRPLRIRALRLQFGLGTADKLELMYVRRRSSIVSNDSQFATNFVVMGRDAILLFAEFEADAVDWEFHAGISHAMLEVLYEDRDRWQPLRKFGLDVRADNLDTIQRDYRPYDNAALLSSH